MNIILRHLSIVATHLSGCRCYHLLALLIMPLVATAQMRGYKADFALSRHHFRDTIAIEVEDHQIYIPVTIDGETRRFCLDTGSSQGMTYPAASLGPTISLGNVVSRDANGRTDTLSVVQLPPFAIGSLHISGYVATVMRHAPARRHYDALIGFDLFNKGLCAKIDTRRRHMILTDDRHAFDDEDGFRLKYKLKWFVPHILVSPFIRHTDEALFDTGSRQLYTINKQSFDTHAYKSRQVEAQVEGRTYGHLAIGTHGVESRDEVAFLHLDRLKWGDFAFTDLRTVTTQGASRIGAQLLDYGALIIDPYCRQLTLQPYQGGDSVRVTSRPLSVAFIPRDGKAAVGLVYPKSEAYRAGLREGDIILRINGRDIPSFEHFARQGLVRDQPNRLTIYRPEQGIREVTFTP